jgi:hypothetical protein
VADADVRRIPNAALVPATEAKKLYCLTESDLLDLPCDMRDNPHGSSVMRLYNHGHLKQAALAKHGSEEGLAAKKRETRRSPPRPAPPERPTTRQQQQQQQEL